MVDRNGFVDRQSENLFRPILDGLEGLGVSNFVTEVSDSIAVLLLTFSTVGVSSFEIYWSDFLASTVGKVVHPPAHLLLNSIFFVSFCVQLLLSFFIATDLVVTKTLMAYSRSHVSPLARSVSGRSSHPV